MNIEGMTIAELRDLMSAIEREAQRRAKEALSIVRAARDDTVHAQHGNARRSGNRPFFDPEAFRAAARDGLTPRQAADRIGCHVSLCYQKESRLGIKFAR
jgi:hypothetical protein